MQVAFPDPYLGLSHGIQSYRKWFKDDSPIASLIVC
jgi:hypothetical protein